MKDYFKQLLEYDRWANLQLFAQFEKQFPQNPRIYELFSHVLSTQRIWLDRCLGLPQSVERFTDRMPAEMLQDLENYHAEWIAFISELRLVDFDKTVNYANSQGDVFDNKLTDILAHLINHGTHHRGSLIILMKEEGFVPPMLDYIAYIRYRQHIGL